MSKISAGILSSISLMLSTEQKTIYFQCLLLFEEQYSTPIRDNHCTILFIFNRDYFI